MKDPLPGVAASVFAVSPSWAVTKTVDVALHRLLETEIVPELSVACPAIKLKEFKVS